MSKDVLIIEAEVDVAATVSDALRQRGLSTRITADGKEGLDLAQQRRPDAIVLCAELPRMSGYSICAKLKKDPELKTVPLLFTSSEASESTFEHHKKLKVRADEYLSKPFDVSQLVTLLGQHMLIDDIELEEEIPMAEDFGFEGDGEVTAHEAPGGEFDVDQAIADAAASLDDALGVIDQADSFYESEPTAYVSVDVPPPDAPEPPAEATPVDGAAQARIEDLERQLEEARRAATDLEVRLSQLPSQSPAQRDVLALKKELNQKDHAILELRDQLQQKDRDMLGLRDRETELESRFVQAEEERDSEASRRKRLEQELEQLRGDRDASEARASEAERRADDLATRVERLEGDVQAITADRDEARQRIEQLSNEKSAAEAESDHLRSELATTQRQRDDAVQVRGELEQERDDLHRDREELRQRLSEAEETAERERHRLADTEVNAGKARQALQIALKMLDEVGPNESVSGDAP
jgi:CheY-like chemotaxis protein